jgi:hypothetical protein
MSVPGIALLYWSEARACKIDELNPSATMLEGDPDFTASAMVGVTPTADAPMDFEAVDGNPFTVNQLKRIDCSTY